MAARDYILCGDCGCKITYDGDDNGRNRMEEVWGDPEANMWTVHLLCPDCIKALQSNLEAAHTDAIAFARRVATEMNRRLKVPYDEAGLNDIIAKAQEG